MSQRDRSQRESRYVTVARIAYQLTTRLLRPYSHAHSPHTYTQPQVGACTLLVFYFHKSYRDAEDLLLASDQILQVLGLSRVPDHSTLCRMYHTLERRRLFRCLHYLVQQQVGCED